MEQFNHLIFLVCLFAPLVSSSIDFISQAKLLSNLDTKYQLASFTNVITKSRYLDLVFIGPNHDSLTVVSYNALNETYNKPDGYQYNFKDDSEVDGFKIIGVLPADFNGDKTTDLMVVFAKEGKDVEYRLSILWNSVQARGGFQKTPTHINETFSDVPHLLDYDGDLSVDFICAQGDARYFWINNNKETNGTFYKKPILSDTNFEIDTSKGETLYAYGDLNGDCAADLFMVTKLKNGSSVFEIFEAKGKMLIKSNITIPTLPAAQYGAPLLEDIDGNGKIDIIIPVCGKISANMCHESKILIYYNDPCHAASDTCTLHKSNCELYSIKLEKYMFDKFEHDNAAYGFLPYEKSDIFASRYMMRSADFDSNGRVDLVAILKYDKTQKAVIFRNTKDVKAEVGGTTFKLDSRNDLNLSSSKAETYQPYALTAVDALGKGSIQFFVIGRNGENKEDFSLSLFEPKDTLDSFWLKVTILCYECREQSTTMIGSNVFYYTQGYKGDEEVGYGTQSSQLTPFSLQAPYMLFGLGQQANYIEYIKVAYRNTVKKKGDETIDMHRFDQLVPNAQLFAIPLENMWRLVMLVQTGKAMWQTLLVLGICCVVCMIIILILHIKEKKEDEREKRKFNAKFNFDAM